MEEKRLALGPCQPNFAISTPLPADGPTVCKQEDVMIESRIEKNVKPIPVPYDEFEAFPKHVEEFFDMIARRP